MLSFTLCQHVACETVPQAIHNSCRSNKKGSKMFQATIPVVLDTVIATLMPDGTITLQIPKLSISDEIIVLENLMAAVKAQSERVMDKLFR
jgi:hypothetical protein